LKIHEYLLNPHRIGVYFCSFDIEINDVVKLLEAAVGFDKAEKREPETYNTLRFRDQTLREDECPWLVDDFKDVLNHLDIYQPEKPPLGPWQLKKPFKKVLTEKELRWEPILREDYRHMVTRYPDPSSFLESYQASLDMENAISLDFTTIRNNLRLNLYSLKEHGIHAHEQFLKSISIIGKKIKISKPTRKFSSRYCYRTYPSAVIVWLCEVADNPIPSDILQYFIGAVRYYEQKEWRVSIVLSAIAVETILAELYEEIKHEPAPPDTLGSLLSQVSKLIELPTEARADAEEVNGNRILSVHRSSMNLGDREARSSLVGATRFTHWAYFNGPFSK
jgi:HEPN domain-containing protein